MSRYDEDEEDELQLTDWEKYACLLCKRQFQVNLVLYIFSTSRNELVCSLIYYFSAFFRDIYTSNVSLPKSIGNHFLGGILNSKGLPILPTFSQFKVELRKV